MGANYQQLPVKKKEKVLNYYRDEFMRRKSDFEDAPNYYQNTFGGPAPDSTAEWSSLKVSGKEARYAYTHPNDDFDVDHGE